MKKKTVSVEDLLADVKKGMQDMELMRHYELTPSQLERLFAELVDAGDLTLEDLQARKPKSTQACPFCSADISKTDVRCPRCDQRLQASPSHSEQPASGIEHVIPHLEPTASGEEASEEEEGYCAWDHYAGRRWLQAYAETVKKSLLKPTEFYSKLPPHGGFTRAFLYGAISIGAAATLNKLLSMILGSGDTDLATELLLLVLTIVLACMIAPLGMYLVAGVTHLCLMLVGGANEGYEATFRVVAYSQGTALLGIIPILGRIAGAIWQVCLLVVGLREVHGASTGEALAAVLIPYAFFCGGGLLVFIYAITKGGFHM